MNTFLDYYRCPDEFHCFSWLEKSSDMPGYFRFNRATLFGRQRSGVSVEAIDPELKQIPSDVEICDLKCHLPFDADEAITNLREERYMKEGNPSGGAGRGRGLARKAYYTVRPWLSVGARKHLQRFSLRGAERKPFPSWPVDRTVDKTVETMMVLAMKTLGIARIPFIWFWPNGNSGCAMMTHDVETSEGLAFCPQLMNLNDSYGVKSSFQLVPAERYITPNDLLGEIRERNFEINIHDWNHDGFLYSERGLFLERAQKINEAAASYGAEGFRSAVLYRNSTWYDAFDFSYDMSFPNVGHLDPQPGGCCTVMPYFIGRLLEMPVTTTQDYSLFHVRNCYSMDLWKRQIDIILEGNGLASFIVHPDYVIEKRARAVYGQLLEHLSNLHVQRNIWIARPQEINRWWRERSQMKLTRSSGQWSIEGPGKERARLAYATLDGQRVAYEFD